MLVLQQQGKWIRCCQGQTQDVKRLFLRVEHVSSSQASSSPYYSTLPWNVLVPEVPGLASVRIPGSVIPRMLCLGSLQKKLLLDLCSSPKDHVHLKCQMPAFQEEWILERKTRGGIYYSLESLGLTWDSITCFLCAWASLLLSDESSFLESFLFLGLGIIGAQRSICGIGGRT